MGSWEGHGEREVGGKLPSMNWATLLRMRGTPLLCEYAPTEPMSSRSSFARAITSLGQMPLTTSSSGGYSIKAAI